MTTATKSRAWILPLILALVGFATVGCSQATGNKASSTGKVYTIKYSTQWAQGFPAVTADQYFASQVEKLSKGRLKVHLYLNGDLGGAPGTVKGVESGSIQMGVSATTYLADGVPQYGALSLPYLFPPNDNPKSIVTSLKSGAAGQELANLTSQKVGMNILGWYYLGFGAISTNSKPIYTPTDVRGLKMRVQTDPIETAVYKSYGASTVPLSNTEVFSGLQSGTINGIEVPPLNMVADKYNELVKYVTVINAVLTTGAVFVNHAWFASLPKNLQQIITSVEAKAQVMEASLYAIASDKAITTMSQAGIKIIKPPSAVLAQFKSKASGAYSVADQKFGTSFVRKFTK